MAASIFNGGLKCARFSDELPPSATRLLISSISCANWTGYASRSGKRFCQSGNRSNRNGGMGTGQNRPTVNLPLAAADLLNRLRQSIHRPHQGKTCNSGAPTKPACVSRRASLSSPTNPAQPVRGHSHVAGRFLQCCWQVPSISSGIASDFRSESFSLPNVSPRRRSDGSRRNGGREGENKDCSWLPFSSGGFTVFPHANSPAHKRPIQPPADTRGARTRAPFG